jgi:5-formaminoimidazole-4-carboxamide-1-beta-D-ribofuranosyl 5'-monophosphate synthetase
MKAITEGTVISITLTITIAGAFAGGAFWLSAVYSQVEATSASVEKMESKLDTLAELAARQATAIEVIRTEVGNLKSPVMRTSVDVKKVKQAVQVAQVPYKPRFEVCSPFNGVPYSMNEYGQ